MHAGHSWGRGDPIMTGFGGRAFEFLGQPGKIYSLLSEKYHQVGPSWQHTADTPQSPSTKPDHKASFRKSRGVLPRLFPSQPCLHSSPRATCPDLMTASAADLVSGCSCSFSIWLRHEQPAWSRGLALPALRLWCTPAGTQQKTGFCDASSTILVADEAWVLCRCPPS